jgi:hypothetical protein
MKVDHDSASNATLNARRAQSQQRRMVKQKERELSQIKKIYRGRIDNVKLNHQRHLSDLNQVQRNTLAESVRLGQDKLEQYRNKIDVDQQQMANKLEHYRGDLQQKKDLTKQNYQIQHKVHSERLHEQATDANERLGTQLKKLKDEEFDAFGRAQRDKHVLANRLANDSIKFQANLKRQESEISAMQRKNKNLELKSQADFQLRMQQLKLDGQKDLNKQELMNKKNFEMLQNNNTRRIRGRQEAFKQKIVAMKNAQEQLVKRIKVKYDSEMQKLISNNNKQQNKVATRIQDNFYQMRHLTPALQDGGDHYLLAVPVSPHERDNISLTANDRELVLTYTRRFNQNLLDQAGNHESTKRSEVLTSRVSTPDIVTTKNLVSNYQDNQLIFKVKKK